MAGAIPRRKLRLNDPTSTRELILEEAMRVVGRRGVEGLKVKDLADAVGVKTPSVYKHFASRDAIISELARRMSDEIGRFLEPDLRLAPKAWMDAWARALVWLYASRPAYVMLVLREIATPEGIEAMESALGPAEEAFRDPALRHVARAFQQKYAEGLASGAFRETDLVRLTAMLNGAVLSAVAWPYHGRREQDLSAADLARLQDDVARILRALVEAD